MTGFLTRGLKRDILAYPCVHFFTQNSVEGHIFKLIWGIKGLKNSVLTCALLDEAEFGVWVTVVPTAASLQAGIFIDSKPTALPSVITTDVTASPLKVKEEKQTL